MPEIKTLYSNDSLAMFFKATNAIFSEIGKSTAAELMKIKDSASNMSVKVLWDIHDLSRTTQGLYAFFLEAETLLTQESIEKQLIQVDCFIAKLKDRLEKELKYTKHNLITVEPLYYASIRLRNEIAVHFDEQLRRMNPVC